MSILDKNFPLRTTGVAEHEDFQFFWDRLPPDPSSSPPLPCSRDSSVVKNFQGDGRSKWDIFSIFCNRYMNISYTLTNWSFLALILWKSSAVSCSCFCCAPTSDSLATSSISRFARLYFSEQIMGHSTNSNIRILWGQLPGHSIVF